MPKKRKPAITPEQALNNFRLLTELSERSSHAEYRAAVNQICKEALSRGIADLRTPRLLSMLRHALAFLEHCHAHGDVPIGQIDTVSSATDGGPEMECDLKGIRDALAESEKR